MGTSDLTPKQVVDTLLSFLRVTIEQIWYNFEIYPLESFRKCSFYDLDVYSSRHPQVIAYLDEFESSIRPIFEEGDVFRIYLDVLEKDEKKYSVGISLKNSLLFEQIKNDTQFMVSNCPNQMFNSFNLINELKKFLYSVMLETASFEKRIVKEYGNFRILLSTADDHSFSKSENWILEKSLSSEMDTSSSQFEGKEIRPMKEVNLGYLSLKGYVVGH